MNEPQKNLVDEKEFLKTIEKEGEEMLQKLKDSKDVNDKTLLGLMQVGEKEFIKKTGRRMTYAEMRSAYG